jgi:hypothetical protein
VPDARPPTGPLFAPDAGVRLVSAPELSWDPVAGARGYRVRLYRGARLVLEAVARRPKLTLNARWRYAGRRIALSPATYRWYVWPIAQQGTRTPRLLKASWFVLVRAAKGA